MERKAGHGFAHSPEGSIAFHGVSVVFGNFRNCAFFMAGSDFIGAKHAHKTYGNKTAAD